MPQVTQLLISDEEIERVHGNASFGREPKRRVVEAGVLKAAMGYEMGSTLTGILLEHGLIRSVKNRKSTVPELTRKGQDYLRAMTFNVGFHKVLQLLSPSDPETEA